AARRVVRGYRVAPRVRGRVAERVGGRKPPQTFCEVGHRTGERDAQGSFGVLLVSAAIDFDEVGEDRGNVPAATLRLVLAGECLTEETEGTPRVAPGMCHLCQTAKCKGLCARVLRP